MTFAHHSTPVVVVSCRLAGLAIMRSLGPLGVPLYGVDSNAGAPAMRSRYCRRSFVLEFDENNPKPYIDGLVAVGREIGQRAILIATSDETTQVIADHADRLRDYFMFQDNSPELVRKLASKREMFDLATRHAVPTPATVFPRSLDDVLKYAERGTFPVMLKGIYGNRLELRTRKKMMVVDDAAALVQAYLAMEDPENPNLMLQEYIPGGDDQVYIFNGYFDRSSDCLVGFTGYKIRQFPVHVGCASLGENRWIPQVAETTTRFMKAVGYQGILDIGYRLDPRDGQYKVLDINPRIGQAFRLFVAQNDHDVVKSLYLDFTNQPQPPVAHREGRRWMIEDFDLISSYHYYGEGSLTLSSWLRSFRGLEECAWFDWRDPAPLAIPIRSLSTRAAGWVRKRAAASLGQAAALGKRASKGLLRNVAPLALRKQAAIAIQKQGWISPTRRQWWSVELVRDLADKDVDAFHEFLWTHHLGYAESYEPSLRFGAENLKLSRRIFFADLKDRLPALGMSASEVHSVLEVGCSLGHQLRWMETDLFPQATELVGVDIDDYAIRAGSAHLRGQGSRVHLETADMRDLEAFLRGKSFDLIVCTGVLMYLNEAAAAAVVEVMLRHARIVAFAGLAHPSEDNATLARSDVRHTDSTFIHNLDRMVVAGGGAVRARRWEGARDFEGNTVYFVFANGSASPAPTTNAATGTQRHEVASSSDAR